MMLTLTQSRWAIAAVSLVFAWGATSGAVAKAQEPCAAPAPACVVKPPSGEKSCCETQTGNDHSDCCGTEESERCEGPCEALWASVEGLLSGSCELGDPFELFGESPGVDNLGGWFQFGYHSNSNGLFNNHDSQFGLHQFWFYLEREADGSEGLGWGYRVDVVYGLDGPDTQSFGNNPGNWDLTTSFTHGSYGWAIPQAYLDFAYEDWSVKVGHFYTLVGYEVVPAPNNFFYSHAYTMYNSEPYMHTGALATYGGLKNVELYAGWTAGWDTGFDRLAGGDRSGGSNFLGGASLELGEKATFTYITTLGDLGHRGEGYSHSLVLDVSITEKLNWVFQSDLVETTPDFNSAGANHQFSLNQYLFYTFSDRLKAGARVEWWKSNGNSQYEATFGVNVRPHANLVIRPEIRHDWNPGLARNFTTFAIDAIVTF